MEKKGKLFAIIALVMGIAGICVAIYGLVETKPNLIGFTELFSKPDTRKTGFEDAMLQSYRDAILYQTITTFIFSADGLIMGLLAGIKGKEKLGFAGAAAGGLGLILGIVLAT